MNRLLDVLLAVGDETWRGELRATALAVFAILLASNAVVFAWEGWQ